VSVVSFRLIPGRALPVWQIRHEVKPELASSCPVLDLYIWERSAVLHQNQNDPTFSRQAASSPERRPKQPGANIPPVKSPSAAAPPLLVSPVISPRSGCCSRPFPPHLADPAAVESGQPEGVVLIATCTESPDWFMSSLSWRTGLGS
jgi:hypothetical protein